MILHNSGTNPNIHAVFLAGKLFLLSSFGDINKL
jgi:hypothetical protein